MHNESVKINENQFDTSQQDDFYAECEGRWSNPFREFFKGVDGVCRLILLRFNLLWSFKGKKKGSIDFKKKKRFGH